MLNKSKYVALICGMTSTAVTVLFYFLTFDSIFAIPIRWLSLVFLIIAEVVGTIKAFCIKRTIINFATVITSGGHIGTVLLLSIVFVNIFPLMVKSFILVNVCVLGLLVILDVIIFYFYNRISCENNILNESQSTMRRCVEKASELVDEFRDTNYKKGIYEIVELLKYSDNSCLSKKEMTIIEKLDELHILLKNNDIGIDDKINDIKNIIKWRSLREQSNKYGIY